MAQMRPLLETPVLVGVGAAFDFHAGLVPQAPPWMQQAGLEWAYRLTREPRRLWRRYLRYNPRFVGAFALQLTESCRPRSPSDGDPRDNRPRAGHASSTTTARIEARRGDARRLHPPATARPRQPGRRATVRSVEAHTPGEVASRSSPDLATAGSFELTAPADVVLLERGRRGRPRLARRAARRGVLRQPRRDGLGDRVGRRFPRMERDRRGRSRPLAFAAAAPATRSPATVRARTCVAQRDRARRTMPHWQD